MKASTVAERGTARTGHFLLCSDDVGKRDFPAHPLAQPQMLQPRGGQPEILLQIYRDYYNHTAANQDP
jgi:hypothetical protein